MGQKVNPIGFRLGFTKGWSSKWFSGKDYSKNLHEDLKIRKIIDTYYNKTLKQELSKKGGKKDNVDASISNIEIVRFPQRINIFISTARAGVVIGPKGSRVEALKKLIQDEVKKPINVSIREVKQPDLDANVVAQNVARQLENRVSFRRAMKQTIGQSVRSGAKGIKLTVAGRLGGADMARTETYKEGSIPLHTLRADIDYGTANAVTTYGIIGIKAWVYKGEIYDRKEQKHQNDAGKVISSSVKGE